MIGHIHVNSIRDSQRAKLYEWENICAKGFDEKLSLREMQALSNKICRSYSIPQAKVSFAKKGSRRSWYYFDSKSIKMATTSKHHLIHEVAHHVADMSTPFLIPKDCRNKQAFAAHGKIFAGVLIHLMCSYLGIEKFLMVLEANRMGVDFIPRATPKALSEAVDRLSGGQSRAV